VKKRGENETKSLFHKKQSHVEKNGIIGQVEGL
jgi:hypothetical protein